MVSASPRGLNQRKPGAAAQRRNCRKEKEDDQLAGGEVMYAALVRLTVDPEQASAAAEALMSDILPRVRSASGFVAGYWLEPADGQGFSVVLFQTEEQAREAAPPLSSWAAPGIAITGIEFRRVAATA
jgi:hypothetical protein